jgi:N-acetylglutamate synthase-like GNAT family acetyltransferase
VGVRTLLPMDSPLLVRTAEPADRLAADALVTAAGWTGEQRRAWRDGAPAIVLYDPADTTVHGAVMVSRGEPGVFDLMAWAVAPALDQCAAARRLVDAMANRVRRAGGERMVVSVHDETAGSLLEACGFHNLSRCDENVSAGGIVVTYHLEL